MMNKFFAILLVAILALSTSAFAATYTHDHDDIRFDYDDAAFEISMDDHTDDEDLVILTGKNAAWGDTYIRIYLHDLEDGEKFPTLDDFAEMPDTTVTQGDWNGYKGVFMYTLNNDDSTTQDFFIAPVMDEDGDDVEDLLTVEIGVTKIEDEDIAMERDDLISAVVDSLVVDN